MLDALLKCLTLILRTGFFKPQFSVLKCNIPRLSFEASKIYLPILQGKAGKDVHDQETKRSEMTGLLYSSRTAK